MSDNVFSSKGCPAKMSDSRQFTDWSTRSLPDLQLMKTMGVASEHTYRQRLQEEGQKIIEGTAQYFVQTATCKCEGSCTLRS